LNGNQNHGSIVPSTNSDRYLGVDLEKEIILGDIKMVKHLYLEVIKSRLQGSTPNTKEAED